MGATVVGSWITTRTRSDTIIEGDSQEKICNRELEGKGQNPGIRRKWLTASWRAKRSSTLGIRWRLVKTPCRGAQGLRASEHRTKACKREVNCRLLNRRVCRFMKEAFKNCTFYQKLMKQKNPLPLLPAFFFFTVANQKNWHKIKHCENLKGGKEARQGGFGEEGKRILHLKTGSFLQVRPGARVSNYRAGWKWQRRYEISYLCLFCTENEDLPTPRTIFTESRMLCEWGWGARPPTFTKQPKRGCPAHHWQLIGGQTPHCSCDPQGSFAPDKSTHCRPNLSTNTNTHESASFSARSFYSSPASDFSSWLHPICTRFWYIWKSPPSLTFLSLQGPLDYL